MKRIEIENELNKFREENRFRNVKTNAKNILNFSSNDYLALASDKKLLKDFYSKIDETNLENFKLSSSSSRLIDGSYSCVLELEKEIEKIYKKPALVFNSGFDANSSVIETFFNKNSLIISDRLNHASIYDGCINSGAKILRYNHLDITAIEKLLEKYSKIYDDILVVTETVYSMDGDIANISEIAKLKEKYNFHLMVDEAHSYGVFSYGIAYLENLISKIDFLIIPLGKGGASVGAFVICEKLYKDYLINKSRKFIYSTALPPINNFWNLYILKNMNFFEDKRKKLNSLVNYTLNKLKELNIETTSTSHIISIVIGENKKTMKISKNLEEKGYLAYAIKEPTVPKNTARLRVSLTADMQIDEIDKFLKILKIELGENN